jgi:aconitate hydratase
MAAIESTPEFVQAVYQRMRARLGVIGKRLGRPLTLTERILFGHLDEPAKSDLDSGVAYVQLRPDRVAMQDATAQMALLQFMLAGMQRTAVPTTVQHATASDSGNPAPASSTKWCSKTTPSQAE